jgi:hypothetical protein
MNECHTNFTSFYKYVCQICFQCMILVCETCKLWMNEFCMIFIIKLWNVKFVIYGTSIANPIFYKQV